MDNKLPWLLSPVSTPDYLVWNLRLPSLRWRPIYPQRYTEAMDQEHWRYKDACSWRVPSRDHTHTECFKSSFTTLKGCPLDFFLWRFVSDTACLPPLPANADDLPARITGAAAEVTPDMLRRTWVEINYRWDIRRATSEVTQNCNW
jgi:hypothetical protein